MYKKLDKIRTDLEKAKLRRDEAIQKVKEIEDKLQEAENTQILADVSVLNLTPEQVAQFLQLAASGQLPMNNGTIPTGISSEKTVNDQKYNTDGTEYKKENNHWNENEKEKKDEY